MLPLPNISAWQLFKWETRRKWESSPIRRYSLIAWAYTKIWLASVFAHNEFNKLLIMDRLAMTAMDRKQRGLYSIYVSKTRCKIGKHKFDPNLTMETVDKQFQSLP